MGDAGSSCKYNLFISDSGWRIIKDAPSQREDFLLTFEGKHASRGYLLHVPVFWNMSSHVMFCLGTCCAERVLDSRGLLWVQCHRGAGRPSVLQSGNAGIKLLQSFFCFWLSIAKDYLAPKH